MPVPLPASCRAGGRTDEEGAPCPECFEVWPEAGEEIEGGMLPAFKKLFEDSVFNLE